jgi:hemolysin activation/secretion protein
VGAHSARIAHAALAISLALAGGPAAAQAPQGQQIQPTRDQLRQNQPERRSQRPARVRVRSAGVMQPAPCPLERFDLQAPISTIRFQQTGGGALRPEITELLAPIAASPPSGPQPLKTICDIRDRATAALRQAGYVATVQIPPQKIESGELTLDVVTAKLVEVRLSGNTGPYTDTIEARIEQLKALDPFNAREAERILLLAGDVPGLDVQLALQSAGTAPGELIGNLTVDYVPFSLIANVQNLGPRQLGREAVFSRAEFYGLTGASDVTYIGGSTTLDFEEQQIVQLGHVMGLGSSGITAGASFTYAWSEPDLGDLDFSSRALIGRLDLTAPLLRTTMDRLNAGAGFELVDQKTRVGGTPLTLDKLRIAFLRLDGEYRDPATVGYDYGFVRGEVEVRQGLDILDASPRGFRPGARFQPSRPDGDPTATVFTGDVEFASGLTRNLQIYGRVMGQLANNPLLNFQEFPVGNLTIGRGYDPGANSGDRAIGFRGEVRLLGRDDERLRAEVFAFADHVWIYNFDDAIENDRRLSSWGGGLRFTVPGQAFLEVMYARPQDIPLISVPGARKPDDRILFSLTVQFSPNR